MCIFKIWPPCVTKCFLYSREHKYNIYVYIIWSMHKKISFIIKVCFPIPWFIFLSACIWRYLEVGLSSAKNGSVWILTLRAFFFSFFFSLLFCIACIFVNKKKPSKIIFKKYNYSWTQIIVLKRHLKSKPKFPLHTNFPEGRKGNTWVKRGWWEDLSLRKVVE